MSRALAWAFAMGLILLAVALMVVIAAPSSPVGTALLLVAIVLLAAVALVANWMARRAKGWYRVTPRDRKR